MKLNMQENTLINTTTFRLKSEINIKMFKCKLIHILDFLIENIFNTDARVKFRPKTNLQSFIRMRNFELPPLPPFVQHKVIIIYYKTRRLLGACIIHLVILAKFILKLL